MDTITPIVTTSNGQLLGAKERGVFAFKAIPYAAPPVGSLRFRPPRRAEPWREVRDATQYGAVPFQHPMPGAFGALATPIQPQAHDSLLLNVWTPDFRTSGLPVLVWIHGGAYFAGSGSDAIYNGAAFARDGVVCVTINYRLGVEGFLYLGDRFDGFENSGCNGTADQVAALEWVRDNIAAFGGDPGNVTIAGESAGAFSVSTLMAVPAATGLFRRAISQSGGAHNVLTTAQASRIASVFLDRAGIADGDLAALQALPGDRTVGLQEMMANELMGVPDPAVWGEMGTTTMAFQPTVGAPFLPTRPLEAIAAGSAAGVDLMVGWNAEEALIFVKDLSDIFSEPLVRASLDAAMAPSGRSGEALFELYRRNRPGAAPYVIASAAETDRMFRIPSTRLAEAQLGHRPNVYMYRFDWRSKAFDGDMGAFHLLEVPFVFDNLEADQSRGFTGPAPQALATAMHGAWAAFARSGDPGGGAVPPWPRYTVGRRPTMIFDTECKVVDDPVADERTAWEGVAL
jgi:para-nitrobenzyl esterase